MLNNSYFSIINKSSQDCGPATSMGYMQSEIFASKSQNKKDMAMEEMNSSFKAYAFKTVPIMGSISICTHSWSPPLTPSRNTRIYSKGERSYLPVLSKDIVPKTRELR